MATPKSLETHLLGQTGVKLLCEGYQILIDPYLSNSVAEKEDLRMCRLHPIPVSPTALTNIDYVLITHVHRDHCDVDTLLPLSVSSPQCVIYGPLPVIEELTSRGLSPKKLQLVTDKSLELGRLKIIPIPAAHPDIETNKLGGWQAIGYVIETSDQRVYHAGDTSVDGRIIEQLQSIGAIDLAFIPVNEKNFYRDKMGIIGNMSVREAFQFAEDIQVKKFVPTHWDMFAVNQVYKEEIELLYDKIRPNFELIFEP